MTLIDTIVSSTVSALLFAALATSMVVMLRTAPQVEVDVAEARGVEQLLRYLPADVAATPAGAANFSTVPADPSGCTGDGADVGSNALRMTSTDLATGEAVTVSYRVVISPGQPAELVRVRCAGATQGALGPAEVILLAAHLDPIEPVEVTVIDDGAGVVGVVVTLTGSSGLRRDIVGAPMAAVASLPPASTTTTTTTTTATTTTMPPATSAPLPVCAENPFRNTFGFEAFVETDLRLGGGDSYGPIAAGGDVDFGNYLVTPRSTTNGFIAPGESVVTGLLVGESIDWGESAGTLVVKDTLINVGDFSDGMIGAGNPNETNLIEAPGTNLTRIARVTGLSQTVSGVKALERPDLVDFPAAFDRLETVAASFATLPGACSGAVALPTYLADGTTPWSGSGPVWLKYQADKVNVFNSDVAQLEAMNNVNFAAGSAAMSTTTLLLINVSDVGALDFSPPIWAQNHPRSVIWNFPNATSIRITGPLWGSLLAPDADVELVGDMRGNAIAKSLVATSGSMDWDRRFHGVLPWDPWTPS